MKNPTLRRELIELGMYAAVVVPWANRPACSSVPIGQRMRCPDLGQMMFVNTGKLWMPELTMPLAQSGVPVIRTGDTTEQIMATFMLPAGMLGPNGALRLTTHWTNTPSASYKQMRLFANGSVLWATDTNGNSTTQQSLFMYHLRNQNNQASQIVTPSYSASLYNTLSTAKASAALDTSKDIVFTLRGLTSAAGEFLQLEGFTAEVLPAA